MNEKSCVGNGRLFYFNDDGKLELFYMQKQLSVEKILLLFSSNVLINMEQKRYKWVVCLYLL